MRSKLIVAVAMALALGATTAANATSSSQGSPGDNGSVELHPNSNVLAVSFQVFSLFSNATGSYGNLLGAFNFGGYTDSQSGHWSGGGWWGGGGPHKPPRDAGYVPEPGAIGVFSVGLLVAGALIRRLRKT